LATDIQLEKEYALRKLEIDKTVRRIIEKHYYKVKNCGNISKTCYILEDVYIALNSDHVIRWAKYIDAGEATIHKPPYILRKVWLEGAQKTAASKSRKTKKSKNKDTQLTQS